MKFTLSWLKDHLDTEASLTDICDTLTRIGLEVEHVEDPAAQLKHFKIAAVLEATQHPNADRLRVCMVDIGDGAPIQVVCGAPNARAGMKSVFAGPGVYIPAKKITLGKGTIRGVESMGMLCSAAELDLSEDHDGIIDLPADAPVGETYAAYAGLNDPVIEINLTPNRPDATGVAGIARDLAASGLGRLKSATIKPVAGAFACPVGVKLDFGADDAGLAPQFALRMVRGVKNGPSPDWMQKRLRAIGLRPINALVDITNYMAFDYARPLHVFDAKKVTGDLIVRRARPNETIAALDGKTYALTENMVVIADDAGVESLAGVMGGAQSGCDEQTTDVLIESALWDAFNIARTGRRLGLSSDARYRFERGVDPAFCVPGAELATQMVLALCGGEASELIVVGEGEKEKNRVAILFAWDEVERLTGVKLAVPDMARILGRLGFIVEQMLDDRERAFVYAPSWRPDIEGPADLVEEILRIAGLDKVISTPLLREDAGVAPAVLTVVQKRVAGGRRALAARGLAEAITWSFVSKQEATLFGGGAATLALTNPIAADLSDMRPSLLPGLLRAAQRNADRGYGDVALFEIGQIFRGDSEKDQFWAAAGVRRGNAHASGAGRNWADKATDVNAFDAKADVFSLLASLGVPQGAAQLAAGGPAWMHPGRSGVLQFGPKNPLGFFGEIHPRVLQALDLTGSYCAFEIILNALPAPKTKPTKAKAKLDISDLMPLERDFAFIVDRSTPAADLLKAVLGADRQLIANATIFDAYEGQGVPEGKKSLGVSVTLAPHEKTLTDAEIEAVAAKIVTEATKKTGAVLRG